MTINLIDTPADRKFTGLNQSIELLRAAQCGSATMTSKQQKLVSPSLQSKQNYITLYPILSSLNL